MGFPSRSIGTESALLKFAVRAASWNTYSESAVHIRDVDDAAGQDGAVGGAASARRVGYTLRKAAAASGVTFASATR